MKVAKEFKWEMGHRLPFHSGKCKNLHGHSYKLIIEFEGEEDEYGMVIDYYEISRIIKPIIEKLDHSVMVYEKDESLIAALKALNSRMTVVPFHTTAENICKYFIKEVSNSLKFPNISAINVWVFETENTYANKSAKLIS